MAVGTSTALILGAIGAGASLGGGALAANASGSAAQTQVNAANAAAQQSQAAGQQAGEIVQQGNEASAEEIRAGSQVANDQLTSQLQEIIRTNGVYSAAGQRALQELQRLYSADGEYGRGFDAQALAENMDPGYQFRLEQGQKGIEGSAAARGSVLSSRAMKEVARFNSGLASQETANAFSRFANQRDARTGVLSGIFNAGAGADSQTNQARMAAGSAISGNTMAASGQIGQNAFNAGVYRGNALLEGTRQAVDASTGAANALAAGRVGAANAINRGIGGAVNAGLDAYSIYKR